MNISIVDTPLEQLDADALILVYGKESTGPAPWSALDEAAGGLIATALASVAFSGKTGRCLTVPLRGALPVREIILAGSGAGEELALEGWRRAVAAGTRVARRHGARRVAVGIPGADGGPAGELAAAATESAILGGYRFTAYKPTEEGDVEALLLAGSGAAASPDGVRRAEVVARATCWARDLINESPSRKRPPELARVAAEMAADVGLRHEIVDEERAAELGLNALLAVGGGSAAPPRLVVLEHRPPAATGGVVLLVGKGVTFDTGGISIKPGTDMDEMKGDMSGAAAVLAAMRAVAELALPVHVVALTPLAENMPGGRAYRPGDLIRAYGGKTIEVLNTDAEGRLVLADALAWGRESYAPACIVDLATLTGACVVALGDYVAGLMGNDEDLAVGLLAAGERTGERVWRLPMFAAYRSLIESRVADVKNTGGRAGGAISAAKFLQEFVGDTPWAHLDIAGPAYLKKRSGYRPRGGTGFGVRLLVDWLASRTENGS